MNRHNLITISLTLAVLISSLAACGSSDETPAPTTGSDSHDATSEGSTGDTVAPDSDASSTTDPNAASSGTSEEGTSTSSTSSTSTSTSDTSETRTTTDDTSDPWTTSEPATTGWCELHLAPIQPTVLEEATVGQAYSVHFTIEGVNPADSLWTTDDALPPGFTLGADGLLAGVPSEEGETHFTLMGTLKEVPEGCVALPSDGDYTLVVVAAP